MRFSNTEDNDIDICDACTSLPHSTLFSSQTRLHACFNQSSEGTPTYGTDKDKMHLYSAAFAYNVFSGAVVTGLLFSLGRSRPSPTHTDFDLCGHIAAR